MQQALDRLSAAEQGSVRDTASALRPVAHAKKEAAAAAEKTTRRAAAAGKLLLLPLCLLTFYWVLGRPKPERFWQDFPIMVCVLCLILFLLFSVMGLRYLTCPLRARRYPCRGRGTATEVVAETGFDAGFARIGAQMHGAAAEPGQGGFWQVWFMAWNELRPDHWFPVIHYTDENGQPRAASYPYGGLRGCWQPGQTLAIAWRPQDRGCVYPLDRAGWLVTKGLVYLAIGLGCAVGTAASWVWWWNSMAPYLS